MTNDLLPCPFNHKHELERYITGDGTMVSCCSCGIEMHVDQWNTRANKPAEVDLDACRKFYNDWFGPAFGPPEHLERIQKRHEKSREEFAVKLAEFITSQGHLATGKGGGDETDYSEYYRPERLEYTMCGKIYARHKDGTRHMFMDVRGWGHLTGGGAKALPHEVATGIQDAWAREVVDLWNNKTTDQQKTAAPTQIDVGELEKSIWYCREDWQLKDGYEALYEHMDVIIKAARDTGETTDGYHTLNELYEHRHILFLCVLTANIDRAWRSKLHNDGTMFDGWFIAGLKTVMGQATYHLPIRMWSLFHLIPELEKAPPFDGHTAEDTLKRLRDDAYFKHRLKK